MNNSRIPLGWGIELLTPNNIAYCLVRRGIARVVLEACDRWKQELPRGGRLLDVGCGSQPYRPWIERGGLSYVGVDWPSSPSQASSDTVQWDLTTTPWPFEDASFDAILCTEVLEHYPDPPRLVAECARVCRPGTLLVFTAPLAWPEHLEPYDYYRFTQYGLRRLFDGGCYSVEKITPRGGWHTALGQLIGFWATHAFPTSWNYVPRVLSWPVVAMLEWLDTKTKRQPELLLTLGFTVFARRGPM
jgi:SAM-dependent methyltransferase